MPFPGLGSTQKRRNKAGALWYCSLLALATWVLFSPMLDAGCFLHLGSSRGTEGLAASRLQSASHIHVAASSSAAETVSAAAASGIVATPDANLVSQSQALRRKTLAPLRALEDSKQEAAVPSSVFARFFGGIVKAAGLVLALMMLLYLTKGFEGVIETTKEMLTGQSPVMAGVLGLAVGALHTLAGPDHLAGLAPLVIGQRRSPLEAFGLGALWGSGHATGQLLIGLGCLLVKAGLVQTSMAPWFEQFNGLLVGASLIAIGLLGLNESRKFEASDEDEVGEQPTEKSRFGWATFATGVVHGLSLDAIIFLTPALALPRVAAISHVVGVTAGTLLSMGVYTAALSAILRRWVGARSPKLSLVSSGASGIAILLGVMIALASCGISIAPSGLV
mmetsp:Transcript_51976/g.110460  ORF Transcript_51976/g.110460 Transcript_51976/m.110460 type:complete len:392 (-) Transcript_51976:59-1234(-)